MEANAKCRTTTNEPAAQVKERTVTDGLTRGVLMSRALKLKCPQCGQSPMFHQWFRMYPQCNHCGLKYERDPGYFLGSIYINYGLTAIITTIVYIVTHFAFDMPNWWVVPPLLAFCIIFPLFFFPFARAYWLAMDLSFDKYKDQEDLPPPPGYQGPL